MSLEMSLADEAFADVRGELQHGNTSDACEIQLEPESRNQPIGHGLHQPWAVRAERMVAFFLLNQSTVGTSGEGGCVIGRRENRIVASCDKERRSWREGPNSPLVLDIAPIALIECSALRRFACIPGVARGNPVEVRDCPAAVIGNERVNSTGSHELGSDASRHGTRHRP